MHAAGFPNQGGNRLARHRERYAPDEDDHGIGDIAQRNAESDCREQFGTGRRTQNTPEDDGTARAPEPFDRSGYRDEYGHYGERYGEDGSHFPGRGWSGHYPGGDRPGWRGDTGMGRACSGIKDIHNEIRVQPRSEWPYDKGVAPGSRPGTAGQGENMMQSAIENMPPRE
jgi:hypothetical protein